MVELKGRGNVGENLTMIKVIRRTIPLLESDRTAWEKKVRGIGLWVKNKRGN